MGVRNLQHVVEAVLFASETALSVERIAGALERKDATPSAIREIIAQLNESYRKTDRTFEIVEVAGGYKMMTLPEYNNAVRRVLKSRSRERLSQAAMETLAIVAYRQPVIRAEIENIRGVEAGPLLRMLVDRGLVRIVGRAEILGHPLLYGTTRLFLETFGLKDLSALPSANELMARQDKEMAAELEKDGEDGESDDDRPAGADDGDEPSEAVAGAMAALAADEPDADHPADTDQDEVIRLANHRADAPVGETSPEPDRPAEDPADPGPPDEPSEPAH